MLWAGFVLGGLACSMLVANLITSRTKLRRANADLDRLARIDALTGLYNRRQAQASLDEAVANARRYDHPLSILMIDIDHFKQINDSHGHAVGDDVLRFVATLIRETLRAGDLVARWGGEEFLAVLPSTDRSSAEIVAERVRTAVSQTPVITGDPVIAVSVSIGAAVVTDHRPDELITAADAAMYAAKTAGRDTVHIAR
jgi:diguanylate cyclase (GGDEF)-like protein